MTAFSVAPVGGFPSTDPGDFPDFMQLQNQGVNLGDRAADTIDFATGLRATRGVGASENVVQVTAGVIAWRDVDGDDEVTIDDIGNGIATQGTSGEQVIAVHANVLLDGECVLILQEGAAQAVIAVDSGMELVYRTDTFSAATAGQGSVLTLIAKGDTKIIVCGDLALA
jgi:hypothetical protein